jgi:hypothetical protein
MTDTTEAKAGAIDRDGPVPVALALLDRQWPCSPPLVDAVGFTSAGADHVGELETNPRYLLGRFQQAVIELLGAELPPMDGLTSLLSAAITDAIAWRLHEERPCPDCGCVESLCASCSKDLEQADRYHALARALGAVANP